MTGKFKPANLLGFDEISAQPTTFFGLSSVDKEPSKGAESFF
jgi:hypothetical protein